MIRRLPIVATLVVLLAVGLMIGLGIWQLQRLQWKEALLAHYQQAEAISADAKWPLTRQDVEQVLYRHSTLRCERVLAIEAMSGRNASDQPGWAHVARCKIDGAGAADVVLGWSNQPNAVAWSGGVVSGIIGPGRNGEARLIASPPLAGLAANAAPDPKDIPNNHLSYAVQWFLFAATALVIYALALRKRLRAE